MNTFKQFERKHQLFLTTANPNRSFLSPSGPFSPLPTSASPQVSPVTQGALDPAARFGHSFARIALFPSIRKLIDTPSTGILRKIHNSASSLMDISQEENDTAIRQAAQKGLQTPSTALPFLERIQQSFGRHEIRRIQAHLGPQATASARAMHAAAYATGTHVVFAGTPDLHTVAHEAAHVVQQHSGVQLTGGVSGVGDYYEKHADAVADQVMVGHSSEDLLNQFTGEPQRAHLTQLTIAAARSPQKTVSSPTLSIIQRGGVASRARGPIASRGGGGGKRPNIPSNLGKSHYVSNVFIPPNSRDFYKKLILFDTNLNNAPKWLKMNDAMLAFQHLEDLLPKDAINYSQRMRITLHNWINITLQERPEIVEQGRLYDEFIAMHPQAFRQNGACTLAYNYPLTSIRILLAPIGHRTYTLVNISNFVTQFLNAWRVGHDRDPYTPQVQQAIYQMEQNPVVEKVDEDQSESNKGTESNEETEPKKEE